MKILKVRLNSGELDVSFKLARFIADWPIAHAKFIAGMAERLRDWQPVLPGDFTMSSATSLGEARCQLRLFQGACSVILEAEGLKLSFRHAARNDYPTIIEVISRSSEWLASDLGDHGRDWALFNVREHVQALNEGGIDEAEIYLNQFAFKDVASTVRSKVGVCYAPSARVILSDQSGLWVLRRTVEKSEWISDGGLFVETNIHLLSPELATYGDVTGFLSDLDGFADEATGLHYEVQS